MLGMKDLSFVVKGGKALERPGTSRERRKTWRFFETILKAVFQTFI